MGWGIFSWQLFRGVQSIFLNNFTFDSPFILIVAFIIMLVYIGFQIYNWHIILRQLGGKSTWFEVATGYSRTFLTRYIPGTIWGYLSRSEWMYQKYKIPYLLSNSASLLEVILTIITSFIILALLNLNATNPHNWIALIGSIIILFLPWMFIKNKNGIFSLLNRKNILSINNISLVSWGILLLRFSLQWLTYGLIAWITIISVIGFPHLENYVEFGFFKATFAFTGAWIVGFLIPFFPGGLGVRELLLTKLISDFFYISQDQSLCVAILLRLIGSLAELIWSIWSIKNRSK